MKIRLTFIETIKVPDEKIPELYDAVLEKWGKGNIDPDAVPMYDIVLQAAQDGIIDELPEDWDFLDAEDFGDSLSGEDVEEIRRRMKRKAKREASDANTLKLMAQAKRGKKP